MNKKDAVEYAEKIFSSYQDLSYDLFTHDLENFCQILENIDDEL